VPVVCVWGDQYRYYRLQFACFVHGRRLAAAAPPCPFKSLRFHHVEVSDRLSSTVENVPFCTGARAFVRAARPETTLLCVRM
jgi:hypothetical protein